MNPDHEQHLTMLLETITDKIDTKYRAGQKEHGGKLWQKPHLLDEAINEAADQLIYLLTIEQQQRNDDGCTCRTVGKDDGMSTCWNHHDCSEGNCTHQDGED